MPSIGELGKGDTCNLLWFGYTNVYHVSVVLTLCLVDELSHINARNAERLNKSQAKTTSTAVEALPKPKPRPSVMSDTEMDVCAENEGCFRRFNTTMTDQLHNLSIIV